MASHHTIIPQRAVVQVQGGEGRKECEAKRAEEMGFGSKRVM
jgi:hypothetical protein